MNGQVPFVRLMRRLRAAASRSRPDDEARTRPRAQAPRSTAMPALRRAGLGLIVVSLLMMVASFAALLVGAQTQLLNVYCTVYSPTSRTVGFTAAKLKGGRTTDCDHYPLLPSTIPRKIILG